MLQARDGTLLPARALSDGTLRFLGLAVLELDPRSGSVICLEEPENGIHPEKISSILGLLQDIATDVEYPDAEDNPLRQVISNTHSPSVVQQVPEDSLLMAELQEDIDEYGNFFKKAVFIPLSNTWRTRIDKDTPTTSIGKLLVYLNPVEIFPNEDQSYDVFNEGVKVEKRVIDREDVRKGMQLEIFHDF